MMMPKTKAAGYILSRKRRPSQDVHGTLPTKKVKASETEKLHKHHDFDSGIASMDPQLLADLFAQVARRHYRDSTAVELDDKHLPSKAFLDTTAFQRTHILDELPGYLERFAGGKENLTKHVGPSQPHTLFVCSSGIRAADVTRALRTFRTDESAIAKLFAKHLKLRETIEYVKKTSFGIGVGTPARLNDLVGADALSLTGLERIVIDGSYLDDKKRTLFTMKDLFAPTSDFLNRNTVKSRLGTDVRILVF